MNCCPHFVRRYSLDFVVLFGRRPRKRAACGRNWLNSIALGGVLLVLGGTAPAQVRTEPSGYWDQAAGLTFDTAHVMYVWDRQGRVWIVENDVKLATPLLDLSEEVGAGNDCGLLGFALHPNFRQNGYLYALYGVDPHPLTIFGPRSSNPNEYQPAAGGRLTRYTARASDNFRSVDLASRLVLIGQGTAGGSPLLPLTHGAGSLIFGTDGTLLLLSDSEIQRVDPDTGAGVPGNPLYDAADPFAPRSRLWVPGTALGNKGRSVDVTSGTTNTGGLFVPASVPPNTLPSISDIGNFTINENASTGPIAFTVGDAETAADSLVVSGNSSNPVLVPNANIVFGGSGPFRSVTVTPAADQSGDTAITVSVSDGVASASDSFLLTVLVQNTPPTISDISDQVVSAGAGTGPLSFVVGDAQTAATGLLVTGVSSNPSLVPNTNIVFGGSDFNRTVTVTPAVGQSGTAVITVTVSDGTATASDSFVVTVQVLTVDVLVRGEAGNPGDMLSASILSNATLGVAYGSWSLWKNNQQAAPTDFRISTAEEISLPGLSIPGGAGAGDGGTRSFAFNALRDYEYARFTLGTRRDKVAAGFAFKLDTNWVGASYGSYDVFSMHSLNGEYLIVNFEDDPGARFSIQVHTSAGLGPIIPVANNTWYWITVLWDRTNTLATLKIYNAATWGLLGTSTLFLENTQCERFQFGRSDDHNVLRNAFFYYDDIAIDLTGTKFPLLPSIDVIGNQPPTISDIADVSINQDSSTGPIGFQIGDVETPVSGLTLLASSSNPALIPTNNIVFGGSGSNRTVTLTPLAGQSGNATITVTVSDGAFIGTDTFVLGVIAPNNTPPTISDIADVVIDEDSGSAPISFTIGDGQTAATNLALVRASSNPALIPTNNIVFGGTGANRTVTVIPTTNQSGTAIITVTVSDGVLSAADTFLMTVDPVNDIPTISSLADQTIAQNTSAGPLNFTVGDVETTATSLTVAGTSSNQALVPDAAIAFGGSGSNRTVTVTPLTGQTGTATITVSVSDGAASATRTFLLTVTAVLPPTYLLTESFEGTGYENTGWIEGGSPNEDYTALVLSGAQSLNCGNSQTIRRTVSFGDSIYSYFQIRWVTYSPYVTLVSWLNASGSMMAEFYCNSAGAPVTMCHGGVCRNGTTPLVAGTTYHMWMEWTKATNANGTLKFYVSTNGIKPVSPEVNITNGAGGAITQIKYGPQGSGNVIFDRLFFDDVPIGSNPGSPPNQPPTISNIADQTVSQDTATPAIPFTIGDAETAASSLTLTRASSNTTLVPTNNIVFGGSGSNRTVTVTPATGQSGTSTITVTVGDGSSTAFDTFVLTVVPPNTAPTISDMADRAINEDTDSGPIPFIIGDAQTNASSLLVTRASSNTTLVPTNNIVFGGNGSNRTVTVTPSANQFGTATITVGVSDGTLSASDSFVLTVAAVNDVPVISDIADLTIGEDAGTGPIPFAIGDVETSASTLSVVAASANATLVPTSNILFAGTGTNRTITLTPAANQFGSAAITVTVSDGSSSAIDVFLLTVTPVNDPPTLSDLSDLSIDEDTVAGPVAFSIGDPETVTSDLVVSVTSSNPALVPTNNIVLGGTASNRTVSMTPLSNEPGSTMITLTVTDGVLSASDSFVLTVNAVNDAPTISDLPDFTVVEDSDLRLLAFAIADVESDASSLVLSAGSSNPALVPTNSIVFGGSALDRTISFTPAANQFGSSVISVTVSDGSASATDTFVLTVTPVNDPPVISDIGDITVDEDVSTGGIPFGVSDVDTAAGALTVTAVASDSTLVPNGSIVFDGSGGSRMITVTPAANQFGSAVITVTVSDGVLTASDTFTLTVNPVNDAPTISLLSDLTADEDTVLGPLAFAIADAETDTSSLTLSAESSNPSLVPTNSIIIGDDGTNRTMTIIPAANQYGSATIVVTVSDGVLSGHSTFVLTVAAVNDSPTISGAGDIAIDEDGSTGPMAFTVGDLDSPVGSLTVSATSSNPALVPANAVTVAGAGSDRTVTITPPANRSGSAIVAVVVSDGALFATNTFVLTVNPVNDPPTIAAIADRSIMQDTATGSIPFEIGDIDNAADDLIVTGSSSNPTLVADSDIVFGGAGSNRTVTVTPVPGQTGGAVVTVEVKDGVGLTMKSFLLTVLATNAPPSISDIADLTIDEDSDTGLIAFVVGDPETDSEALIVTADSSNPSLVPTNRVVLDGNDSNRTLTVTPLPDQFGTTIITVTVSDGEWSVSDTFVLTVSPVNDAPSVSSIADQRIMQDTATALLAWVVGDVETDANSLTVGGNSSNPALVPNEQIVFGGSGSNRTVLVTPAAGQAGVAKITLTVSDGGASTSKAFDVTVTANTAPAISALPDQFIDEDTTTGPVAFTVTDAETPVSSLTLIATSSNTALVPTNNIIVGGSAGSPTITLTPAAEQSGFAVISVTVSDGALQTTRDFLLTVSPVNDPPVISSLSDQSILQDTVAGPLMFSVGDVETDADSLAVTGYSSNPALVLDTDIVIGGSGSNRTVVVTPVAGQIGSATIWIAANDGSAPATKSFVLTVTPTNAPPTIAGLADLTIDEDANTGTLQFFVGDDETTPANLLITTDSSNPVLVTPGSIILGGSGTNRTLVVTPVADQSGSAGITILVSDGLLVASKTFILTVNPVNDAPTISDLGDVTIAEDGSTQPIRVGLGDIETDAALLTLVAASSNPALIPVENIAFGGSGADRTVTLTPLADQFGVAIVTITVSDGDLNSSDTFTLTVNAVNDAPTISDIAGQVVDEDTPTGMVAFTIGDVETPANNLTVSASSSNTALVPTGNIVIDGSGGNRTIQVLPATNQFGTAIITVTVNDGALTASNTFLLAVNAVNDIPMISDLADQGINEDAATGTLSFIVGDAETPAENLTVNVNSSNPAVVPASNITLGGSGADRTIRVVPATNQSGSTTITVTVDDGALTASETFMLTVNAVNDAPTLSDVPDQVVDEDIQAGPIVFAVDDLETPASDLIVTASSSSPALLPASNIIFGGSGANRTVTLHAEANQAGTATITVLVSDGASSSSDTFMVTVNPVNDGPAISNISDQNISEDAATAAIPFTIGDVETPAAGLIVSASSSNPTLVPSANIGLSGSGANRAITITPATNQSGSATITVTVSDGALVASDVFVLSVAAVNDVPTISDLPNQTTSQGTSTAAIPFTIGDVETPAASLTLARASSNQTLVPTNNIAFGGSGSNRTVTVTPAAGQSGTATITVSASDGAASVSDAFVLTVTSGGNTAPTISDIADRAISEDSNTGNISFAIGDAQTAAGSLTLSRGSSNPALVPTNNIVFGGSSANRTVRVTPLANQFGAAIITVTVSDGSLSTSDTFVVTVNPVNDAPTISDTSNRTTLEDTSTGPIPFVISDVDTASDSLVLTATSSNPTRVPVSNIVFGGSGTSRTVTVTPGSNQTGSATITITVSDGALTASDSFSLTVSAVNDPPTISDLPNRTVARGTSTGAIGFTIGDAETAANSLTLSKASSNLTLVPTNNIVFGGSGANRTVTVTPAAGQSGTATITVTVSDGAASASDVFVLTVQ